MPYRTNADLPDPVRTHLPPHTQDIYRETFNHAFATRADDHGMRLLRELKARRVGLPVIVVTGHGDIALAVTAMKEGAIDFIEKPFDDEVPLAAIRSALSRQAKNAERETQRAEVRARIAQLSARERQVLDALVAGDQSTGSSWSTGCATARSTIP
ncbi:ChaB family protein [Chelatococcus sp. SYSU_G07232]|uniref:ChaB family protein n=1 Tax=Chelatococcus albus TaxID=3047466 RepID=A0ABT7AC26_9HYPH|nr:ChaB family protein [Chelatococcus sp. SYSU_G07232]MDJ1156640.1 ChaB family protein [Chelatococcus sp. SYSU_G07232]